MGFFWLRFHAAFYNSLKINVSINRAWPRPASPSRPPVPVSPDRRACWSRQPRPTGPHVYLTATKIWYRLKRFSGTKCHNWGIWFRLKRFPRTTGQKTVTTCAENVLARTPKLVVPDFSIYKTSPGRGGASGGSLRSSRQAVACHPFTR